MKKPLESELNFCSFIDVLGYKNIVFSNDSNSEMKIERLEDIYMNMFSSISISIRDINRILTENIFIKSYSDSVYLQIKSPEPLIFALYNAFNITFGYYINFSDKFPPLLRAGIVYDWTLKIMDIASLSRQNSDEMFGNDEYSNIIGLGVARSYLTSEKSNISGMRILISQEVMSEIKLKEYKKVPFECYFTEIENYLYNKDLPNSPKKINIYFTPIRKDEKGNSINLHELFWPVFTYSWNENKSDIFKLIHELIKIKGNFNLDNERHLIKTAELMKKSLILSLSLYENEFKEETINLALSEIDEIINK